MSQLLSPVSALAHWGRGRGQFLFPVVDWKVVETNVDGLS